MKKWIKIALVVQIQVIFGLSIFILTKVILINNKVFNTNKFIYEALIDKRINTLNTIRDNDIVIGDRDAPVSIFLYSRFGCSACSDFFRENYKLIRNNLVEQGVVKIVVRFLVRSSEPKSLYFTKCAYYAYQNGDFNLFIDHMNQSSQRLDSAKLKTKVLELTTKSESNFRNFVENEIIEHELLQQSSEARHGGIRYTPTFYINNQRLIGNRNYEKLERVIFDELDNIACE